MNRIRPRIEAAFSSTENNRSRVFLSSYHFDFYFAFLGVPAKTIKAALEYKLPFNHKPHLFLTENKRSHGFYSRKYSTMCFAPGYYLIYYIVLYYILYIISCIDKTRDMLMASMQINRVIKYNQTSCCIWLLMTN